jgi:hypothetical protein
MGSELFEQLGRHTIVLFDSELEGTPMNEYQITMQILREEHQSTVMLQFVSVKQRDLYQMRKYSYQIMRQLFKTFTHEFGTCLNYQLALTQTAEEMQDIPEEIQ